MKALYLMVGKLYAELKFFSNLGQRSRSRSCDQKVYIVPPAQCESPMSNGKKVVCIVKVFQM